MADASTLSYKPQVLVDTADLPEKDWLEYRRRGIGGSDAASILGVSPFKTARDLYYDKLKIVTYEDPEENWVQKKMGHLLEDLVAEIFHVRTGYEIYQVKKMFYHPKYPFMLADVDYFITMPNGETAILEIKTTNYNATDHWWVNGVEAVPVNYEIQGRHYMAVMNVNHVFFCCLYGNSEQETIIRHIVRDMDYEEELIALEGDFWNNHILTRTPPQYVEDGDLVIESVKNHFGSADPNAAAIELSFTSFSSVVRYLELQAEKSSLNAEVKRVENEMKRLQGRIIDEMGRCCTAVYSRDDTDYTITYNPVQKATISKEDLFRLQMQHPEIYEQFVSVSESRRFYVKKKAQKAA